ncbi:hypothetical protein [Streptomyces rishiriensis]|uniref:hypothetical protein n=1 Tax=Streptomyces rishiriensis TaxID=68264 RepID=UPI000D596A4A|nr:hypothetical protein [Streptomyces rishiriensis]
MITHLALGWIAVTVIVAPTAAVLVAAALWTYRRIRVRLAVRRLIRDVQLYVHRPMLRPLFDTHDQPRKETP